MKQYQAAEAGKYRGSITGCPSLLENR